MGILELEGKVPQIADRLAQRDQKEVNAAIKSAGKRSQKTAAKVAEKKAEAAVQRKEDIAENAKKEHARLAKERRKESLARK